MLKQKLNLNHVADYLLFFCENYIVNYNINYIVNYNINYIVNYLFTSIMFVFPLGSIVVHIICIFKL